MHALHPQLRADLQIAGVPPQKFRAICSAIDKLDKVGGWAGLACKQNRPRV